MSAGRKVVETRMYSNEGRENEGSLQYDQKRLYKAGRLI
jgi:hypothetical protein